MNATEPRTWTHLADKGSYNQTVVVSPPKTFEGGMWHSVCSWGGEILMIKPPSIHPFRHCVQCTAGKPQELQFAVCLSLAGGSFDLQIATTNTQVHHAKWQSEAQFIAKVIIQDMRELFTERAELREERHTRTAPGYSTAFLRLPVAVVSTGRRQIMMSGYTTRTLFGCVCGFGARGPSKGRPLRLAVQDSVHHREVGMLRSDLRGSVTVNSKLSSTRAVYVQQRVARLAASAHVAL